MASFEKGLLAFVLCAFVVSVETTDRSDYILEVFTNCGTGEDDDARITIITDLPATAFAYCSNGEYRFSDTSEMSVQLNLNVSYRQGGSGDCIFYQRAHTRTYVLYVKALFKEDLGDVRKHQEQSIVTCSFDMHGNQSSPGHTLIKSYLSPLEIQTNVGATSTSGITLTVRDILGNNIPAENVLPLRKSVQLFAVSDGIGGEVGIKPISCDLVGVNDGSRYPFIRAGCGDGFVLPKQSGFYTNGLGSQSSFFSTFNVARDKVVKFSCNFTMCNSSCDGSSCQNERPTRQADFVRPIQLESSNFIIRDERPVLDDVPDSTLKIPSAGGLLRPTTMALTPMQAKVLMTIGTFVALVAVGLPAFICIFGVRNNRISPGPEP